MNLGSYQQQLQFKDSAMPNTDRKNDNQNTEQDSIDYVHSLRSKDNQNKSVIPGCYIDHYGYAIAAVLAQGIHLDSIPRSGKYFYKINDEYAEEVHLSPHAFIRARQKLIDDGVYYKWLEYVGDVEYVHYYINYEEIAKIFEPIQNPLHPFQQIKERKENRKKGGFTPQTPAVDRGCDIVPPPCEIANPSEEHTEEHTKPVYNANAGKADNVCGESSKAKPEKPKANADVKNPHYKTIPYLWGPTKETLDHLMGLGMTIEFVCEMLQKFVPHHKAKNGGGHDSTLNRFFINYARQGYRWKTNPKTKTLVDYGKPKKSTTQELRDRDWAQPLPISECSVVSVQYNSEVE